MSSGRCGQGQARCWPPLPPTPCRPMWPGPRQLLMEAEANAAEAAANAERARGRKPQAPEANSRSAIRTAEQTAKTGRAWKTAALQLNAQQLRLKFTQVLAPDSGVISARTATVGAVVELEAPSCSAWCARAGWSGVPKSPGRAGPSAQAPRCRSRASGAARWKAPMRMVAPP